VTQKGEKTSTSQQEKKTLVPVIQSKEQSYLNYISKQMYQVNNNLQTKEKR